MTTAHQAASGIRKWAIDKNLLRALPASVESTFVADVNAAIFSEDAENSLRQKGLSSIAYSDLDNTVYVYTKKRVTVKDASVLPNEIFGCSVIYTLGGTNALGSPPEQTQGASYSIVTMADGHQHYCCGSSISPGNAASAGTLAAIVKNAEGINFGLTNNHVTGGCSHSPIGLPILAPGVLDVMAGGLFPFTIGVHQRVLEMVPGDGGNVNILLNTDAALFQITDLNNVSSMQGNFYDTPGTAVDPEEGMIVEKVGRTTGHTTGRIVGRELLPTRIGTSAHNHGFQATIVFPYVFIVHGDESPFSDNGDSGSLIVTTRIDGTKAAVGLLFAGGPDSKAPGNLRTLMLPIKPILERFAVTLVEMHNVHP